MKTILGIIKTMSEEIKKNRFIFLYENIEQKRSYYLDQASASIVRIDSHNIDSWIMEKEHFNPTGLVYIIDEVFFQLFEDGLIPHAESLNSTYKEHYLEYVHDKVNEMQERVRELRYTEKGIFSYYCSVFSLYDKNFLNLQTCKEKANYFLVHDDLTEELKKIFNFFYTNQEPIFIAQPTELNRFMIKHTEGLISSDNVHKLVLSNDFIPGLIFNKVILAYYDILQLFEYKDFKNIENLSNLDQLLNIQIEFILCLNAQKNTTMFDVVLPVLEHLQNLINKEKTIHLDMLFNKQSQITKELEQILKKNN